MATDIIETESDSVSLALFVAAKYNLVEVCNNLILLGGNINFINDAGETPLFIAARHGSYEMVEFLLAKGTDKDIRNHKDVSAAQVASQDKIIEILSCDDLPKKHRLNFLFKEISFTKFIQSARELFSIVLILRELFFLLL